MDTIVKPHIGVILLKATAEYELKCTEEWEFMQIAAKHLGRGAKVILRFIEVPNKPILVLCPEEGEKTEYILKGSWQTNRQQLLQRNWIALGDVRNQ